MRDAVSGRFGVDSGGSTKAVGLKGGTREFVPASNQYVNLGTKDICSGYPLTVASWIRWDDVSATGFIAYSLNDTNCSAILGAPGGSGWAANASSAPGSPYQQKGALATGLNHFVTIHRNGTWDIYVNGVIQPNGGNATAWGQPAAGNHSIGGRLGGSSLRPMDGQVQDLQVYQGELTPTEIRSLYRNHWQIWQAPGPSLILPLPSAGGATTIACNVGTATTAGISAGISAAKVIACNVGTATTAGISAGISSATTISCNAGTASTAGISAGITQATTIACNAGTATVAGIPAGISLNSSITISCNAGAATTAGVSAVFPQTISCTTGNATTAGVAASFPQTLSCNVGNATTAGITAQVDIAGTIVIGCNAGTATTAGVSANISSAIVLACNAGTATTLGATAYFPQSLQCSPGNAIAVGIDATFTVAGPTTIVCNVGNATASGISFSFGGTLVDAPNGSGPAIIIPRGTRGAVQNTTRPPNIGGIRI
ncbi:MAG: hypothetical protein IPI94_16115 [Propionivibrio sp.]|nr:hypothetical protein [Propionivibrio sp.]